MYYLLCIPLFSVLYALKGGWHARLFPKLLEFMKRNPVADFFLDGTRLSTALCATALAPLAGVQTACIFAVAWLLAVAPSVGEEAGGIGDYKENWGPYAENFEDSYAWKKGLQRGAYAGALLSLASGYTGFILAGLSFPAVYFAGSSVYRYFHGRRSWAYAEPLYGGIMGIAAAMWLF